MRVFISSRIDSCSSKAFLAQDLKLNFNPHIHLRKANHESRRYAQHAAGTFTASSAVLRTHRPCIGRVSLSYLAWERCSDTVFPQT